MWDGKKQKWESFCAKVVSVPQYSKKEGKQAFACFRAEGAKGFIWLIKCFGLEAEKVQRDIAETGVEISVQGYREEDSDSVFVANFFKLKSSESSSERINRRYGSRANYERGEKEYREQQERAGFVRTVREDGRVIWDRKENCVQFADNTWKQKIEFVMDVFGGAQITTELKALVGNSPLLSPDATARYRHWLEDKVAEAANTFGFVE